MGKIEVRLKRCFFIGLGWLHDGIKRSYQRQAIVYVNSPIQAFISWQEIEEYRHLCDQIGHIFMDLNDLQIYWISLTGGFFFSICHELFLEGV